MADTQSAVYWLTGFNSNESAKSAYDLKVDLIICNPNANERFNPSLIKSPGKKVIAQESLGEIGLIWNEYTPYSLAERMQWDANRDGLPDSNAPKWLGPVNDGWAIEEVEEMSGYKNWTYKNKYPLYFVKYWDNDFLKHIKSAIDLYAEAGWDGISFDTAFPTVWHVGTDLYDAKFSKSEYANLIHSAFSSIRNHINEKWPDFKIYVNSTASTEIIEKNIEILSFLDGIFYEKAIFNNHSEADPQFPVHSNISNYENNKTITPIKDLISKSNTNLDVIIVEYVNDDPNIYTKIVRDSEKKGFITSPYYDSRWRLENEEKQIVESPKPTYIGIHDNSDKNNLKNETNQRAFLVGLDGDDTLEGAGEDEIFMGGSGEDMIKGGSGVDIAVYRHNKDDYEIEKVSNKVSKINIKNSRSNLHHFQIEINAFPLPNEDPLFSLKINDENIFTNQILKNSSNIFKYDFEDEIEKITFKHLNQKYDDSINKALGVVIESIYIDENKVNLSDILFINSKESWAGYDSINDSINPGAGTVEFQTSKYNSLIENEGTDELESIERLSFKDQDLFLINGEYKPIDYQGEVVEKTYSGNSSDYKFYNLGTNNYGIGITNGIDELTGASLLKFDDKNMHLVNDIKATFDQVTGLNTDSGEMFRLYNAAFARFPDADGLKYWIDQFSSGRNTRRVVAQSFLGSAEFTERYGSNVSDETYVNNLYKNVLGRDADNDGLNYWVGNLTNGLETRYEALLGFAESAENKLLFSEMTGFG